MRNLPGVAVILAFTGLQNAQAAGAGDLYNDFLRVCAAHTGDAAGSLNTVSQAGWKPIPQQQLEARVPPFNMPGMKTDWYHAYVGVQPGRSEGLFAGRGELFAGTNMPSIPVAICMVMQKPLDEASLQRAGSWTTGSKVTVQSGASAYLYMDAAAGHQPITMPQLYNAFHSGGGRELVTMTHPAENASAILLVSPARQ